MKRLLAIVIFLYCSSALVYGQDSSQIKAVDQQLVGNDSLFVKKLAETYKNNPAGVLDLMITSKHTLEDLGFGYADVSSIYQKGYLWIKYQFIFLKDSLISYKLDAVLPYDIRLNKRYVKIYSSLFNFRNGEQHSPVYYNYDIMTVPLNDSIKITSTNKKIQFLMTPFSGVTYGYYFTMDYAAVLLDSRINFEAVKKQITPEIDYMLLFSKNPAIRLCAIEYYYRNQSEFEKNTGKFEQRIAAIFNDMPIITTRIDGHLTNQYAEELIKLAIKTKF